MHAGLRTASVVALALVANACSAAAPLPPPTGSATLTASAVPSTPPATTPPPPCSDLASQAPDCLPPTSAPTPTATASGIDSPPCPTAAALGAIGILVASVGMTATTCAPLPTPTVEPSATPSTSPGPTAGEIDHPTDAHTVVLRVEQTGGFVMPGYNFARRPQFTLYGDGTVIWRPVDEPQPEFGFPPMQVAHMNEDQVQALLRYAIGPGRLLNARAQYMNPFVADAPDTVFTLAAGEYSKRVQVTALGMDQEPSPDAADIQGFRQLDALLGDFGKQVADGQATRVGPYAPASYTVMLFESEITPDSKDWPWPEIKTTNLVPGAGEFSGLFAALTPAQMERLLAVPNGGLVGVQVKGPDKKGYSLSVRPDLPDDPAP